VDETIVVWSILIPAVAAPVVASAYRNSTRLGGQVATFSAIGVIFSSLSLVFLEKAHVPLHLDIFQGFDLIELLDYVLLFIFIFISWKYRKPLIAFLSFVQLSLLIYLDLIGKKCCLTAPVTSLYLDGLAVMMILITGVVGGMILIYATQYMKAEKGQAGFFLHMFLFIAVMNAAVLSDNLLWLFFFWEMTTLFSFLLINHDRTEESEQAAFRALVTTLLGGVFLLGGVLWILLDQGSLSIQDLILRTSLAPLAFVPVVLITVAAFTKSALYPFQKWLVGAMIAPTPVSALLHSATMVNLGLYMLFRLSPMFGGHFNFQVTLAAIGGFAFTFGALQAIPQDDVKRLLAYSTISNLGLVVVSIGVGTAMAFAAGLLLLFFHAIAKALLFMAAGVVYKKTRSRSFEDMSMLLTRMPLVANMIYIGVLALVALPFGTFITKWILIQSSVSFPIIIPFVVFGTSISVVYYVQWLGRISSEPPRKIESLEPSYTLPMLLMALIIFGASIFVVDFTKAFVLPAVTVAGGPPPIGFEGYGLDGLVGFYAVIPLFILLFLAVLIPLMVLRIRRSSRMVNPYFGGQPFNLSFRGFYFKKELGERRLDIPLTVISLGLVILLVGVVFA
jgi:ech hydrogenase subunit A